MLSLFGGGQSCKYQVAAAAPAFLPYNILRFLVIWTCLVQMHSPKAIIVLRGM